MNGLQSGPACEYCGSPKTSLLFTSAADEGGVPFSVARCANCGVAFTTPQPSHEELLRYYLQDYYGPRHVKFEFLTECAVGMFARWRARVLKRFCPAGGRILDVGCGRGNFMALMAESGYEVYGTELSDAAAEHARSRFGRQISIGDLTGISFPAEHFDMVVMWHVLEHVRNPSRNLQESARILKPGGHVVVAVPNFDSLQAGLGRGRWFHLDVPRHLFHFTPETLNRLLTRAEFVPVQMSSLSIEQNPFGLLQTALNLLPGPPNRLYKALKSGAGGRLSQREMVFWRCVYWAFMPPAVLLSTAESFLGRGGTFYVVSRKRD